MKGKKSCPECGETNGCRTLKCKQCNHEFLTSKIKLKEPKRRRIRKKKKWEKIDWHTLVRGDEIKVFQGSGPYHINKEGEKVCISEHGKFTVKWVDENGIHVRGQHGHAYLWMEKEKKGIAGTFLRKHKILKKIL